MSRAIKILMVEDNPFDVELIVHVLRSGGFEPAYTCVDTRPDMQAALEKGCWELVTCDHSMPEFSAPEALELLQSMRPEIPIIIVSGEIDVALAVSLMKKGAWDYVQKSDLERLPISIERELENAALLGQQKEAEKALQNSEYNLRLLFENTYDAMLIHDNQGNIHEANSAFLHLFKVSRQQALQSNLADFADAAPLSSEIKEIWNHTLQGQEGLYEIKARRLDGSVLEIEVGIKKILWQAKNLIFASIRDIGERKCLERKLREQEEINRLVTDNIRDTVWIMDMEMNILWVSPSIVKRRGHSLEELRQMPFKEHLAQDSLEQALADWAILVERARQAGPGEEIDFSNVYEYREDDESYSWVHTVITVLRDENGQPSRLLLVGRDITESIDMRRQLEESEERFRALSENSRLIIATAFDISERKAIEEELRRANQELEKNIAEMSRLQVETSRQLVVLEEQDRDLQASERLYKSLVEVTPQGVYRIDLQGKIIYSNQNALKMFGYSQMELDQGLNIKELFLPREYERVQARIQAIAAGDQQPGGEYLYVRKDGSVFYGLAYVAPVFKNGEIDCMQGTVLNIDERKRMENELLRLNDELEARVEKRTRELEAVNQELEAFSYMAGHDLRAPLRAIDGFASILSRELGDGISPDARHLLDVIHSNVEKMGALIDDLLKFSKVNRQSMSLGRVDMMQLAQEVCREIKGYECERTVHWEVSGLQEAFCDRSLIRQVFVNLCSNAWKFTRATGNARITISSRQEDGEIIYTVADNGVGFDMKYYNRLFNVFKRLHKEADFDGTGVGLAIVQRIVNRHGGRVWAESEPHQGAQFHFSLPAAGPDSFPGISDRNA